MAIGRNGGGLSCMGLFYEIWFTECAWFIGIFTVDIFVVDIAFTED